MTSNRRYRLISLVRLSLLLPLGLAGCQTVEPPSVVVLPDQRMVPAMRLPDDSADTMPRVVEVKVPVAGPQLRPVAVPARAVNQPLAQLRSIPRMRVQPRSPAQTAS